ncbi:MAG: DUF6666 family protein [Planctomycetia bacterium]
MNVANGIRLLAAMALVTWAIQPGFVSALADDGAPGADDSSLRWTPHRAAASPAAAPSAAPRPAPTQPSAAPAAAARIDPALFPVASDAPPSPGADRPRMLPPRPLPAEMAGRPAPRAGMSRAPAPPRAPARRAESGRPAQPPVRSGSDEPSLFGISLFRAPQGDVGRPMFGAEPVPQREGVRPAAAAGEYPRQGQRPVGPGGQRLAMAPGSESSMMSRLPGSSMPTSSMPRPRVQARRVAQLPTPAGELPPPAGAATTPGSSPVAPGRPGRPTPAESMAVEPSFPGGMPMEEEGLTFGGADGDGGYGGYGDMPLDSGDYGLTDPGMARIEGMEGYGSGFPEDGMIYSEDGMPMGMGMGMGMEGPAVPWTGEVHLHIPSFYDDPYACEDGEACPGCSPMWDPDGRICAYFRRFGRPYYGWRWYRDLTVGAGVTSFQNATNLGLHGNYGFNEYVNWSMPFWNAIGLGWQFGLRGVQADFQRTQITAANGNTLLNTNARNQVFLTTGFFSRAFEGRGLQGGAVYDYLQDNWFDTTDLAQIRGELSYVWGYHEFGFWGTYNANNANGAFITGARGNSASFDTLDLYTGFYRLQFGDANEMKIWGGASGQGDYLTGMLVRAPMSRSLALEGTFTYLIPSTTNTVPLPNGGSLTYAEQAWNVSTNLVWYPACRARRSLASPYRPLFEVADNGSMIGTVSVNRPRRK